MILLLQTSLAANAQNSRITYHLSFDEAPAHYVDVKMEINNIPEDFILVKMPVWAPGSYLVREFARHVEGVSAKSGNQSLNVEKVDKNTWKISAKKGTNVTFNYKVYAYELTVRTSFIDASHAFLSGTSIFMYVDGKKDWASTIKIKPYKTWERIATGLEHAPNDPFTLYAPDYDILGDSPIEIGNHEVITFTAAGIPHEIAIYGEAFVDEKRLVEDITKIIDAQVAIFKDLPLKKYVFIVHSVASGGGGLEHLNSTVLQVSRFNLITEIGYRNFLSLVAHEYFHLWNVKRLRPIALGPFDYDKENYTRKLWVMEGFTSYYDDHTIRRIGAFSADGYLAMMANQISTVENTPGNRVEAVADASFDAWIKYYRRNENSNNSQISYYSKGAIIACVLDMMIMKNSAGKLRMDDLMRSLYNEYYIKKKRGFTDAEFKKDLEKFVGADLTDFYKKYIDGTETIPYNDYFDAVGLRLVNTAANSSEPWLGATTTLRDGKLMVTFVSRESAAWNYGLNVNDEIIGIDGYRLDNITNYINTKKPGDAISLAIARDGKLQVLQLVLGANPTMRFRFERIQNPSTLQLKNYRTWLHLD